MNAHVVEDLHEYALNILDAGKSSEVESHLQECRSCVLELGAINNTISEAMIAPIALAPALGLRSRLLDTIQSVAPYSLYHEEMASLLLGQQAALEKELNHMPHPDSWIDGPIPRCRLYPCTANAAPRDAIRTLVLMESGSHFPMHEHLGDETVLILQGSMSAEGKAYRPGDVLRMPKGSCHEFDVPEGLDLIYLAVVDQGIRIGDLWITPANLAQ